MLQPLPVADDPHANIFAVQFRKVTPDEGFQKPHQIAHLGFGPTPVFRREGKEREIAYSAIAGRAHGLAHGLHTAAMPHHARKTALLCPASIAIHDDGDVLGYGGTCRRRHIDPVTGQRGIKTNKIQVYRERYQTCMISFSFSASKRSISEIVSSVIF